MARFFIRLYDWLSTSTARYWLTLTCALAILVAAALRVSLTSDVQDFFPEATGEANYVMHNLKAANKTTFVFQAADTTKHGQEADLDVLIAAAQDCAASLDSALGDAICVNLEQPDGLLDEAIDYVYDNLPFLLTDEDYDEIQSRLNADSIAKQIAADKKLLSGMAGQVLAPIIQRDPLMLAAKPLGRLKSLAQGGSLTAEDGFLISADGTSLVMFADVAQDASRKTDEETVATAIDNAVSHAEKLHPVRIYSYGAPQVSASNSRRVHDDIWLTMSISMTILTVVMLILFRSPVHVLLIILPVAFGALFAFGCIGACGASLSQIAVAAGAMVMGISLSYSIHIVTHGLHVGNATQLLAEMAWPMTVGSLTTIGAFAALLFTGSAVLRDLGLFASLVMVGSLLFSLVFLPKLLTYKGGDVSRAMSALNNFSTVDWSKSKIVVALLTVLLIISLFKFSDVGFNNDMAALNYVGNGRLAESLPVVEKTLGVDGHKTTVVVTGRNVDELVSNAANLEKQTRRLMKCGLNRSTTILPTFRQSQNEQEIRLERWKSIFDSGQSQRILSDVDEASERVGFKKGAFSAFGSLLTKDWEIRAPSAEELTASPIFGEWVSATDSMLMLYVNVEMDMERRDAVLDSLAAIPHVVQTDMGYYARKSTSAMVDDFNWLLMVSSLIVGLALLLSYGRVELFFMTFMPMTVSWIIILGLMALFGVEFNVINIILSTFVFGVGDDYSIFIMDGLLSERSARRATLTSHKTAIILSAFAAFAGLGSQAFGLHPAVRSMGLLSVFGLIAVVVTSFVVQPFLFRMLVSKPAEKGHPYTAFSLFRTVVTEGGFGLLCVISYAAWLAMLVVVPKSSARRRALHQIVYWGMRSYVWLMAPLNRIKRVEGVDFSRPSAIVANHLSVVDILSFLASSPRIVFIVKSWVAKAPVMGSVVRALGFYDIEDENGEPLVGEVARLVAEGYSVVVFPEGGRSADGSVHRFHKGAFLLAKELGLDISPVVFYGNGHVVSKSQPLHVMKGLMEVETLPKIHPEDFEGETAIKDMARTAMSMVRAKYAEMCDKYDPVNPYFAESEHMNNLYKA